MAQQQKSCNSIRIVSVVWFNVLPPLFGGQKGIALFNEHLGKLAPLYCLCSKNNERVPASYQIEASLPLSKVQFINPFCWRMIYQRCRQQKATHLILEFPYYGIAGVLCKALLGVKLVVHAHNLESFRFKDQKMWWWRILYAFERWTLQRADAIFFKTEKDRQVAEDRFELVQRNKGIIPYGIVRKEKMEKEQAKAIVYQRHNIAPGTKLLLFAGTLDYGPNAAAVEAIEKKIIPLLQTRNFPFTVVFCGRIVYEAFSYLKKLQNKHLIYAGTVPDIETYFAAADVFLNPVTTGGGVQTKVVDALNHHLNVVCFEEMTEGITGAKEKLFTAPKEDWIAFSDAVMKAAQYSQPTPASFFEQHDWNNIAKHAYNILCTT